MTKRGSQILVLRSGLQQTWPEVDLVKSTHWRLAAAGLFATRRFE